MRDRIWPKSFWGPEIRERIASQVDAIKHWQVIEGSYEQAPDVEATWFVDPPYQKAGKHYRCSELEFTDLAAWCQTRAGLTVVCENVGRTGCPSSLTPGSRAMNRRAAARSAWKQCLSDEGAPGSDIG